MTNEIQIKQDNPPAERGVFQGIQEFENAQRIAKALTTSTMVPKDYQGNISNTMVALEMANRINASPMAVMQNLHIIHGRPSWSSAFIIAALNACGKFSPLRFHMEGEGETRSCYVWARCMVTGDKLEGPAVTIQMAKAEGWFNKNGSKWKTMPDLMLRYRAASFFGRLYASEILMGMHSVEEVGDFKSDVTTQSVKDLNDEILGEEVVVEGEIIESGDEPENFGL
jgi:hypothetical protein